MNQRSRVMADEYRELLECTVEKADERPDDVVHLEACIRLADRFETLFDFWNDTSYALTGE